jgi:hypothetical protein
VAQETLGKTIRVYGLSDPASDLTLLRPRYELGVRARSDGLRRRAATTPTSLLSPTSTMAGVFSARNMYRYMVRTYRRY